MHKRGFLLATVVVLAILLASCGSSTVGEVALQTAASSKATTTPDTTPSPTKTTTPGTAKEPATAPSATKGATTLPTPLSTPPKPSSFVTEWGGSGTKWGENGGGDGQFAGPRGIATDSTGRVYVADTNNQRVQVFDSDGKFINKWDEDGQFYEPQGIATDPAGSVYVVDADTGFPVFRDPVARIQNYGPNGNLIKGRGEYGSGDGQFDSAHGVATDLAGNVYVADTDNDRIQKFGPGGNFITNWGGRGYPSSEGGGEGQFYGPYGVATDSSGYVYVTDNVNNRIQKFKSDGDFVDKWGERGEGDGQFMNPKGIATDSSDNVYVGDGDNNRVQVFDSDGRFLTKWGEYGSVDSGAEADGKFYNPSYIAIDSLDNVYVSDTYNDRIQKFSPPPAQLVPPAAPSNLNVEAVDSSSIRVEWIDNSTNEDGFEISNGETSATVDTDVTTYTWSGLALGTYMCFEARAFNSAGNSAFTTADCATTPSTGTGAETDSTYATDTDDGGGEDGPVEEIEELLPDSIAGPVEEAVETAEDTFEGLGEGRLPETGGGWAVLLLIGAALVSGGLLLIRLSRRFSR